MASPATFDSFSPGAFLCAHPRLRVLINTVSAAAGMWVVATYIGGVDLAVRQGSGVMQVGLVDVVLATLVAAAAGWGLLALLERRTPRARSIWTAVALVVAVVSLLGPLGGETAEATTALSVMHAIVAAILITGLAPTARPRQTGS
jgi:hypothetical protein